MKSSCVVKKLSTCKLTWPELSQDWIDSSFYVSKKTQPIYIYIYILSLIRLVSSSPILPCLILTCCDEKIQEQLQLYFQFQRLYWRLLISYLRMLAYFNHSHPIPPCRFFFMRPVLRSHICVCVCVGMLW